MFREDQKKFIVKAFGWNPSPTKVKQKFLREYKIEKSRPTAKYKLYQFSRVNKEFEKHGSVVRKQMVAKNAKRNEAKKEEVERTGVVSRLMVPATWLCSKTKCGQLFEPLQHVADCGGCKMVLHHIVQRRLSSS